MRTPQPARLDPVGRLRLPRRGAVVKAALVSVLLLTAAGALYAGDGGAAPAGSGSGSAGPDSAGPATPVAVAGPFPTGRDPAGTTGMRLPVPDGFVGVPVSLGQPASLAVLRPGDRVDLLAVPATGEAPVRLAAGARVLAVDRAATALLLALTPDQGRAVVSVPGTTTLAVVLHP